MGQGAAKLGQMEQGGRVLAGQLVFPLEEAVQAA